MRSFLAITEAVKGLVEERYPENTVYLERVPVDFARPSFLVELGPVEMLDASCGCLEVKATVVVTAFVEADDYYNSHVPDLMTRMGAVLHDPAAGLPRAGGGDDGEPPDGERGADGGGGAGAVGDVHGGGGGHAVGHLPEVLRRRVAVRASGGGQRDRQPQPHPPRPGAQAARPGGAAGGGDALPVPESGGGDGIWAGPGDGKILSEPLSGQAAGDHVRRPSWRKS